CEPDAPDARPELCLGRTVCRLKPLYCCKFCSYYFPSTTRTTTYFPSTTRTKPYFPSTTRNTTTTPFITPTLPKECKPGVPDVKPKLCLTPSICWTQPLHCCNYCSYLFQSTARTAPTTPFITPTSSKACEPGDVDIRPEVCTNIIICQTRPTLCCHYCSLHYIYRTTSTTQLTSPKECVPEEPDLSPELCTSITICQTQPYMC
ncbi:hypothetical protein BgiBS90_032997, partial [Biomphalaria glabrata]